MRFLSFELKGYKPLSYGGIDRLSIESFDQINVLTGENGKGKSSVLRELTPYPATRSDYHKHGYKKIEISHDGKHYVLISDFSKSAAHSFVVDDVEKNINGTTEVQSDLVEQYFEGYSKLIEKLVSGSCKFSTMSRNERKQIFMSTYPSNLEFILDKHKALCSMIRSGNSQLKLLKDRELKLKESLIPDEILKYHQDNKSLMEEAMNALDKDIYAFGVALKPYVESKEYVEDIPFSLSDILSGLSGIRSRYKKLIETGYVPVGADDIMWWSVNIEGQISHLEEQISYMENTGAQWLQEVEKYKDALSVDNNELLKQYKLESDVQMDIISKYPTVEGMGVLDEDSISWWEDHENSVDVLQSVVADGGLWTSEEYQKAVNDLTGMEYRIGEISRTLSKLESNKKALVSRLDKYSSHDYPEDCNRVCRLRDSVKQIVDGLRSEYETLCSDISKLDEELKELNTSHIDLKNAVSCRVASMDILRQFEMYFSNYTWKDFVLNHKTLVKALNDDLVGIVNRMHHLITYTRGQEEARKAVDRLKVINARMELLNNEHLPSRKRMKEMMAKLEGRLAETEREVMEKKREKNEFIHQFGFLKQHKAIMDDLSILTDNFERLQAKIIVTAVVEFVKNEIAEMQEKKSRISEKLRELDAIVREQEGLRLRLHEEILPTTDKIKKDLFKWGLIEEELSPVSGLPKRIMTTYINGIFKRANRFISQVWNYEMELVYLRDDIDCDYTFPVMINGDGIVKDISICSKGQKEIIDLALILSICTYRGYSIKFPLKLDEMSSGLSPDHNSKLFGFLGELFSRDEILQAFIVSHDPIVSNGFDQAGYVALSENSTELCRVISKIE